MRRFQTRSRNVKHRSVSVRLRCEFVLQITLCTQGTASGTRCESSGRRHNARTCILGARLLLVKFRQRISGYAELLQPACRRRLEWVSPGTRSVGLSSRLVREYAIPKYSGVVIFSEHTGGRQLAACTRAACVQAIYNGGLLNSAALNRAQNFKQFAAWHADSSYKAHEICTDFCILGANRKING